MHLQIPCIFSNFQAYTLSSFFSLKSDEFCSLHTFQIWLSLHSYRETMNFFFFSLIPYFFFLCLYRFLRNECINHSFVYESPLPVGRLVVQLADKAQVLLHSQPQILIHSFPNVTSHKSPFSNKPTFMFCWHLPGVHPAVLEASLWSGPPGCRP